LVKELLVAENAHETAARTRLHKKIVKKIEAFGTARVIPDLCGRVPILSAARVTLLLCGFAAGCDWL